MAHIIQTADRIIKIHPGMPGVLLEKKNRKWEFFFDGHQLFGCQIHSLVGRDNQILVYCARGYFISRNQGDSWQKIFSLKDIYQNNEKLNVSATQVSPESYLSIKSWWEFTSFIIENGLPEFIVFDYLLEGDKTGYDCAEFLIKYCIDHHLHLPECEVYSGDRGEEEKIEKLLNIFINIKNQ